MPSPVQQAGATVDPSQFAALSMDAQFTGMWTQRNPLRDAAVPYLYRKFYSASRFDSILDGINREISPRLTDVRRPGVSVYNSITFPRINRFYEFHQFTGNTETIRVIADCDLPANQLQNPTFDQDATGWNFQTLGGGSGWVLGTGAPFAGGNLAEFHGPGTAAVTNNTNIPCTPGTVISASCMAIGEFGATGNAVLELEFLDSTGHLIGLPIQSASALNNYIWEQLTVSSAAPAGSVHVLVRFSVYSSTTPVAGPRWGVTQFVAGIAPIAGSVRDVTGPSTNNVLWTKSAGAGRTSFIAVGNILYGSDGVNTHQWVTSSKTWQAQAVYQPGDFIVDPNGNIQEAIGSQIGNLANIEVDASGSNFKYTIWLSPTTPLNIANNVSLTFAGLTTIPALNGTSVPVQEIGETQFTWIAGSGTITPFSTETGTAATGNGQSGLTPPAWQTALGAVTQDAGVQWVNKGTAVLPWGAAGPATAPVVTITTPPSLYPAWAASTWYAPGSFVINDSNGNIQQLVQAGTTGATQPSSWGTTVGALTTDGTCQWKCTGTNSWIASHAYTVGQSVIATYTYYISVPVRVNLDGTWVTYYQQQAVTVTSAFQCTVAGTSGTVTPYWTNGVGTITSDGPVRWQNIGPASATSTGSTWPGATQTLSLANKVIDSNGYIQRATVQGKSGATPPATWQTGTGASTTDAAQKWINVAPFSVANTGAWQWAYSGLNSITGEISNPSPISAPLITAAGQVPVIQGQGLLQPPWDQIILWRTAQAGTTLLFDDQFANPGPAQAWIYTDTHPDSLLNAQMAAPGSLGGATLTTPPPSTAVAPEYHYGRIWMINGSTVIYSGGPDTVVGNGNSSFPPLNYYQLPEQPIRLKSVSIQGGGLVIFCISNTYVIMGDGATSPFLPPKIYMAHVGLMSYDALTVVGSTFHGFSNKGKAFSFDPSNGYIEEGFPIGDQFTLVTTGGISSALYNPATTYVTWHEKSSEDTGLYVADGTVGWFRWSPIAPPENGSLWSPRAAIVDGTSAVQSVETTPGSFNLLIGPASSGAIRMRDASQYGDWSVSQNAYVGYPSWDVKGSIGLCETGEVAEIAHVALKSLAVGARPIVSLLLDEIKAGVEIEGRTTAWDQLELDSGHHEDPPNLEPSITMFSDRYRALVNGVTPKCENFLLRIDYGTQMIADELLKFAVFGAIEKERRQQ